MSLISRLPRIRTLLFLSAFLAAGYGIVKLVAWDTRTSTGKKNRIGISGYDIMSYYTDNKAEKGNPALSWQWNDCQWYFSSPAHKDLFMANPDKYAPRYGGNCAFTTSLGKAQSGLPKYWQLIDGKLYLNSNMVSHFLWKHLPGRAEKADAQWKKMTETDG